MLHDQGPTPVLPFLPPECAWLAEQSVRSAPPYLSLRLTAPAVWKGPSIQPVVTSLRTPSSERFVEGPWVT